MICWQLCDKNSNKILRALRLAHTTIKKEETSPMKRDKTKKKLRWNIKNSLIAIHISSSNQKMQLNGFVPDSCVELVVRLSICFSFAANALFSALSECASLSLINSSVIFFLSLHNTSHMIIWQLFNYVRDVMPHHLRSTCRINSKTNYSVSFACASAWRYTFPDSILKCGLRFS